MKTESAIFVVVIGAAGAGLSAGCAAALGPMIDVGAAPARAACRAPITPAGAFAADRITWKVPFLERDRDKLEAWCGTTGPPVIAPQPLAPASPVTEPV